MEDLLHEADLNVRHLLERHGPGVKLLERIKATFPGKKNLHEPTLPSAGSGQQCRSQFNGSVPG